MNIVLITQNQPFYIKDAVEYLTQDLPENVKITGCVLGDVSPFGKKEKFYKKAFKTLKIFGIIFFSIYALKYLLTKLTKRNSFKELLRRKNIDIIKLKGDINSEESLNKIKEYKPDLLISIAGNQIFKKELINLAPMGCLNLHTSLLPKYRGLMPTFWVLKNKEAYTGVSVFFVDEGIDSGPIVIQKKIKINNMSQQELIKVSKKIGIEAIKDSIKMIMNDSVELIANDDNEKTYFSFPTRKDVKEFKNNGARFF